MLSEGEIVNRPLLFLDVDGPLNPYAARTCPVDHVTEADGDGGLACLLRGYRGANSTLPVNRPPT